MAVSEEFVEQLREVFRVCDVEQSGTICLSHLLSLAGEHFGSSQNVSIVNVFLGVWRTFFGGVRERFFGARGTFFGGLITFT